MNVNQFNFLCLDSIRKFDCGVICKGIRIDNVIQVNIIDLNYIVYPNPFTDYTTIKLSDDLQTERIELIDIHGRIVRTIDNVNSNSVMIHRDNLSSGIYFIRILSDDTYVKKVIIR